MLAAGSSTRMGRNKLLLPVGGEALVRRVARVALGSGADAVLAVLGHEAARVEAQLEGLPCARVVNPAYARGQGASLRCGLGRVRDATDAIVVLLADMPFVTAAMVATLVERYREARAPLVASRYGEVQAPPTLYDRTLFRELLETPDERGGKRVVERHAREAVVVDWPAAALRDVDVPEDYERACAELALTPPPGPA